MCLIETAIQMYCSWPGVRRFESYPCYQCKSLCYKDLRRYEIQNRQRKKFLKQQVFQEQQSLAFTASLKSRERFIALVPIRQGIGKLSKTSMSFQTSFKSLIKIHFLKITKTSAKTPSSVTHTSRFSSKTRILVV